FTPGFVLDPGVMRCPGRSLQVEKRGEAPATGHSRSNNRCNHWRSAVCGRYGRAFDSGGSTRGGATERPGETPPLRPPPYPKRGGRPNSHATWAVVSTSHGHCRVPKRKGALHELNAESTVARIPGHT